MSVEVRTIARQRGDMKRWDMGGSLAGRVWREANKKADAKLGWQVSRRLSR
ncbi:hypothetical protein RISK_004436 [Rhodopirellula islandica]|uniref:Uncharacterized protein n=1 Tax=Rhodopirellula islandica TaxID=595434 RepID=A0A0J1EDB8_RHOIS|nr:hypothetical protein RISK_004436 [Rhodopirellula islandica]